ncbi:hypothetical protein HBH56_111160 [Parastagonospora nodorum]|uniref:Uncharacterized protein n=1 Tax=Phaeosphaeria nodorum (strain SN15 / ATCC MYA-4574 / FGSC 10173) TaxID=321614 RepID=A0A7U2FDQ6_PHANO|nr:hypothetical protein HBH56_111160 [Parastagonospora nodorum]QRD03398.1 hypothetical protein JI435_419450 [Parastagonospora nodorum SN15]KAH3925476.1 hypothetical protein HBH54_179180 [Parastagonospora nodorum]KAH3951104.1 hypothetical protein HBH53_066850 [Parastagonospora nodorum]KAH4138869.1 hypothetical protein HBH45_106500 [Parastagonospora nodorum]
MPLLSQSQLSLSSLSFVSAEEINTRCICSASPIRSSDKRQSERPYTPYCNLSIDRSTG